MLGGKYQYRDKERNARGKIVLHNVRHRSAGPNREYSRNSVCPQMMSVIFDGGAVLEIIRWARSDSLKVPTAWRSHPAYALTRQLATLVGKPNPDLEVDRILNEIASEKPHTPPETRMASMASTEKFMASVLGERARVLHWAVPHIQRYLPAGTPVRGRVLFAAFIPAYAFSLEGTIVINVMAAFWNQNPDKVLNLLVHELYHNGFGEHCGNAHEGEAQRTAALVEEVFWQVQNEGMATYVAYRAKPAHLEVEDYRLLDDSAQVRRRFATVRKLLGDIKSADPTSIPQLRARLWSEGVEDRSFYIVGAYMARRIEEKKGLEVLVRTVTDGARAFVYAYMSTSPPRELLLLRDAMKMRMKNYEPSISKTC